MGKRFCRECGGEMGEDEKFCRSCGTPVDSADAKEETVGQKVDNSIDNVKDKLSNEGISKFNLKLIIPIIVVLLIIIVAAFALYGNNDILSVKDVAFTHYNRATDGKGEAQRLYIEVSVVPNKNLDHIVSYGFNNLTLSYGDENVYIGNPFQVYCSNNDANNYNFNKYSSFSVKDMYHYVIVIYDHSGHDPKTLSHVTGNIVVSTTTEDNIVVGHIDSDLTNTTVRVGI